MDDRADHADRLLTPTTIAVTAGRPAREPGAPLNAPVTLTSTYVAGGTRTYARDANPTWEAFEEVVGALEAASAVTFASGMAAVAAVLAQVPLGGPVVVPTNFYAGTRALIEAEAARGTVTIRTAEQTDPAALATACDGAALVWIESPANPTMEILDVRAWADAAHRAGAKLVVDNTFATPLVQRPCDLGADLVVHSASKFLAGHSDVILGVVLTRDAVVLGHLRERRASAGAVPGPFETWLALRGVRTLGVRMRQSQESAQILAERLLDHPAVGAVRYPGLAGDPGHVLAMKQMQGFGAMIGVEHAGGADAAESTCERTTLWTHATSLGGVESTLERRRRWEFEPATVPAALIRLSVGCEDVEDLWRDLDRALR